MHSKRTIFASKYGALPNLPPTLKPPNKSKVELEPDRLLSKQSCGDLLALPSQECDSWQKPAELPIGDRTVPALSGLVISFGKTLQYLPQKTVTRRAWKNGHAKKFVNAFNRNKLVQAFDKDRRYGGKQIGWCRLLCAPYKERLSAMPDEDLIAEGGMCSTVEEFVKHYFKGNSSLEVWVIRFEFIPDLEAYINRSPLRDVSPAFEGSATSNSPLISPIESIHQASLVPLGVYPALAKQTNTNFLISSLDESIHQASLVSLGVYSASEKQTNTNFPIPSAAESIHQTELAFLGVYPALAKQTNTNFPIPSLAESIHQDSLTPLGVYQPSENQTNINFSIFSLINSIHQPSLVSLGVYPFFGKRTNTYSPLYLQVESIHQPSLVSLGVYPFFGKRTNTYSPLYLLAESIHQAPLLPFSVYPSLEKQTNTYSPIPSLAESIHQASLFPLGVYPSLEKQTNTYSPILSLAESIHQDSLVPLGVYQVPEKQTNTNGCDSSDTNPAISTASESTNASPTVQGGSGLVYSFWKGESIVNHYRYKIKIGGKWKVKSIYIPVGKLPQVKEAIANKLGVAAIVVDILCKPM